MNTKDEIIQYLTDKETSTPGELAEYLNVSRQIVHRHLKKLTEDNVLEKKGSAPKVYYSLSQAA